MGGQFKASIEKQSRTDEDNVLHYYCKITISEPGIAYVVSQVPSENADVVTITEYHVETQTIKVDLDEDSASFDISF